MRWDSDATRVGFLPLRGPFVGSPGPGLDSRVDPGQGRTLLFCSSYSFFLFFDLDLDFFFAI